MQPNHVYFREWEPMESALLDVVRTIALAETLALANRLENGTVERLIHRLRILKNQALHVHQSDRWKTAELARICEDAISNARDLLRIDMLLILKSSIRAWPNSFIEFPMPRYIGL
ncbi:MAG: hypothetical protein HOO67_02540 [Candidatus Peribacteraceae bacterium]|nr:hypothetical protein [Candidatus Peribacteraceae bacterium]